MISYQWWFWLPIPFPTKAREWPFDDIRDDLNDCRYLPTFKGRMLGNAQNMPAKASWEIDKAMTIVVDRIVKVGHNKDARWAKALDETEPRQALKKIWKCFVNLKRRLWEGRKQKCFLKHTKKTFD